MVSKNGYTLYTMDNNGTRTMRLKSNDFGYLLDRAREWVRLKTCSAFRIL